MLNMGVVVFLFCEYFFSGFAPVLKAIKQVWEEEDINKGIINFINK